jgi:hypothetical protein
MFLLRGWMWVELEELRGHEALFCRPALPNVKRENDESESSRNCSSKPDISTAMYIGAPSIGPSPAV